jgi:hypothetical protein
MRVIAFELTGRLNCLCEDKRGKADSFSQAKIVKTVLDFVRASQGLAIARYEGSLTMGAATRSRQAVIRLYVRLQVVEHSTRAYTDT